MICTKSRDAFEADYLKQAKFAFDPCDWFAKTDWGLYKHTHMECRWEGWQAARKHVLEEVANEFDNRAAPNTGWYEVDEPAEIIRSLK